MPSPRRMHMLTCIGSVIALLAMSACTASVDKEVLRPARNDAAAGVRTIAVLPIENDESGSVRNQLESALTAVKLGTGQAYFQVISRLELDRVIAEQKLGRSSIIDGGTASRLGRLVGAEAIYVGHLEPARPNVQSYNEERKACNDRGKGRCGSWRRWNVRCKSVEISSTFTPKLLDVETGRVLYSRTFPLSASDRACSDSGRGLRDWRALLGGSISGALVELRRDVAPYRETVKLKLLADSDGLGETAEAEFQGALAFMRAGRSDRACEIWRGLERQGASNVSLSHNLGICAELQGDLAVALAYCKQADEALAAPVDEVNQCLSRLTTQIKESDALARSVCAPVTDRSSIFEAQSLLNEMGFDAGAPDGRMGARTRRAIRLFQKVTDIDADGRLTTCTLRAIRARPMQPELRSS